MNNVRGELKEVNEKRKLVGMWNLYGGDEDYGERLGD